MPSLFTDIPADLPEELIQTIPQQAQRPHRADRLPRPLLTRGLLVRPRAARIRRAAERATRLRFEDEVIEMKPGSYLDSRRTGVIESSGPLRMSLRSGWRCFTTLGNHNWSVEPR